MPKKPKKKAKPKKQQQKEAPEVQPKETQALAVVQDALLTKPQASALSEGMKADLSTAEDRIIAFALKLKQFIAGKGWSALGYSGLTEYREAELGFSEFYNATRVIKLLDAGVEPDDVREMRLTNIEKLVKYLPPSAWKDAKTIELAQGPIAPFARFVEEKSETMGMAVESDESRGFRVSRSVADKWDEALRVAKLIDGCETMEKMIETIVANYLNSESEVAGKSRLQVYLESYEQKAS